MSYVGQRWILVSKYLSFKNETNNKCIEQEIRLKSASNDGKRPNRLVLHLKNLFSNVLNLLEGQSLENSDIKITRTTSIDSSLLSVQIQFKTKLQIFIEQIENCRKHSRLSKAWAHRSETIGVNFINILRALFSYESLFWQLFLVTFHLWQKICTKKRARKMLMKSTVGWEGEAVEL